MSAMAMIGRSCTHNKYSSNSWFGDWKYRENSGMPDLGLLCPSMNCIKRYEHFPVSQTGPVSLSHPTESLRMKYVCPPHAFLPSAKTFYRKEYRSETDKRFKPRIYPRTQIMDGTVSFNRLYSSFDPFKVCGNGYCPLIAGLRRNSVGYT